MAIKKGNYGSQGGKKSFISKGKLFLFTNLTALVTTVLLILLISILLDKLEIGEKTVEWLIYGVYIISGFAAGFIAGKQRREKKFIWGALAGTVWMMIILIISVSMNGSGIEKGVLFPAIVCMVGGGMLGGMLA